ncbi:hypothetical protein CRM22_009925 [Opisthorchis felineus]|uniref:Pan3 C-terminal knob domain-containing protein n=1 Tax=Opisthorchis felineus TaxID=147828 RepID=A0A4S2L444_OPIFE|nr:hypothetical protein CRM22_009925 [Opisthorchis felineus]TGZ57493.1 hypothetical protein CRM22_009925 [Opisthorchis felineus]TGZ57494.1 hypothetical protein CRM22_009925 [Opisthorchis felineus]TGZ57495.1 hypothetical protein CRM22_009925 [Opisthorchis felineus]
MASNFYCGGSGGQFNNMLTYPMKGLTLGPSSAPSLDLVTGTSSPGGLGHLSNYSRPPSGTTPDGSLSNMFRGQPTRQGGISDYLMSQMGTINAGALRPPVISGVTGNGSNCAPSVFPGQNGLFKLNERLRVPSKSTDSESPFFGFQTPTPGQSASRVLSNLQDSNQMSFSNQLSSDLCSPFVSGRFGGAGGDSFHSEDAIGHVNEGHVELSHLPTTTSSLDNILSIPPSYAPILPSPGKSNPQAAFQSSAAANPNLNMPVVEASIELRPDGKLPNLGHSRPGLTTQYYTSQQFNAARDLQASGNLKAANWILVPPVPEGTAAHMRTGRVHELKSRACTDRVFNASYMDHELKQVLHNKVQACLFTSDEATKEKLPRNLGAYTDLVPLEVMHQPRVSVTFGLPCVCFKAWSPRFGRPMLLRRVILPVDHEAALSPDAYLLAKQLSELDHPAVVGFRDVFFTNAFNDNSAVVVYEYTPCSSTLQQTHMSDPMKLTSFSSPFNISRTVRPHSALKSGPSDLGMLSETTLWSYLVQLVHGIRFIHQQVHRACGILDPTKVLIQDGTRLRINCFGLKDILFHQSQDPNLAEDQAGDFVQLGKLLVGAACGTAEAIQTSQRVTSFNLLQRTYRPEMVTLLRGLISGQITGVDQLMRATSPYVYDQLTTVSDHSDFLERQLFLGMECDRLFRLICKLQSIVERNDRNGTNPDWSETGDRYMLKLFRDFVFHQTDQLGAPYLDLSHIITTLNKVEASSHERLCLVSRDSQNVILMTYADIKQWLDSSFSHLVERHRQSRCEIQMAQQREIRQHQQQRQQQQQQSIPLSVAETDAASGRPSSGGLLVSESS